MQVKELGHAVLYVRDLERSRHFYGDILGFTQIGGGPARDARRRVQLHVGAHPSRAAAHRGRARRRAHPRPVATWASTTSA